MNRDNAQELSTETILAEIKYCQTVQRVHHPDSSAWKLRSDRLSILFTEMSRRSK